MNILAAIRRDIDDIRSELERMRRGGGAVSVQYGQCRYPRRSGERCTAEVADEQAEALLCAKHLQGD